MDQVGLTCALGGACVRWAVRSGQDVGLPPERRGNAGKGGPVEGGWARG